jgi:hypothetical protein
MKLLSFCYKAPAGLLLAVGCFTSIIVPATATNLLVNGSFEADPVSAGTLHTVVPAGWFIGGGGGAITYLYNNVGDTRADWPLAQAGNQFVGLTANPGWNLNQTFHVATAGTYRISWYDNVTLGYPYLYRYTFSLFGSSPVISFDYSRSGSGPGGSWIPHSLDVVLAVGDYTLQFGFTSATYGAATPFWDDVRVESTTVPDLIATPPPPATVQCDGDVSLPAADTAAFLALGGSVSGGTAPVTVSFTSDVPSGSCPKIITRTYTATDVGGRTATCSQTITVNDTTAPMISPAGADATIECPATPVFTPPTATDNCDPAPRIIEDSDVVKPGACAGAYDRTKTWHAVDACGNPSAPVSQTITVKDDIAPVIGAAGANATIECPATPVFTPPTATDNCDPAPTIEVVSEFSVTGACPGTYSRTRIWRAVDACGNPSVSTVSQTITVQDTTPPSVDPTILPGSLDRTVERGDAPALAAALALAPTFNDTCSGAVPATSLETIKIPDPTCIDAETMIRRWTATDSCGNTSAEFTQTIQIKDTTAPTITCPADMMIVTGPGRATYSATATDNADPSPTVTLDPPSGSTFAMGRTPVTCTATDRCGNTRSCTFYVTVTAFGCTAASLKTTLRAFDASAYGHFGYSVAIDGDMALVGAPGAAYLFSRNLGGPDNWSFLKKLTSSPVTGTFGDSVALSGDTIVVGANGAGYNGSAFVFERNYGGADQWGLVKVLNPPVRNDVDSFGISVRIKGDTIVVGASELGPTGSGIPISAGPGAAYLFGRNVGGAAQWGLVKTLVGSDPRSFSAFGTAVGISAAEDTIVVGAPGEGGAPSAPVDYSGAAYVFSRDQGGLNNWGELTKMTASDAQAGDGFGGSVGISGDTVVVGAPGEGGGTGTPLPNSGAAYVFGRDLGGLNNWGEVTKLTASDAQAGDAFGNSVATSGDTIVVGARYEDADLSAPSPESGASYVFGRDTRGPNHWGEIKKMRASDPQAGDLFGNSVAISGATVVVGAPYEDGGAGNPFLDSGAAYVFTLPNEPCARDDFFRVPAGVPVLIPVSALLANDAHSRALPISFAGNDPATVHALAITHVGSPVTALSLYPIPADLTEDTFTYHVTDGTHDAPGIVHLRPVTLPTPPENTQSVIPPAGGSGVTILFNAPAAGTYVQERMPLADLGHPGAVWTEIARQIPSAPGVIAFADGLYPGGALYRIRRLP